MQTKSTHIVALPIGIYKGVWSGFTVVVAKESKAITFEVQNHSVGTVECSVMVKTNNVGYITAKL